MKVAIVGITAPTNGTTPEQFLVDCARVSNPNAVPGEGSPRLLAYMVEHAHWSPFEMVSITMEIHTTRDISRQILRHRSFSFQEFSQRYAETPCDMVARECRLQHPTNRQDSIANEDAERLQRGFTEAQRDVWDLATSAYHAALAQGIAKEQARALLPEGLTATRLYMAGTLRSWMHYCDLRGGNGTQREHMAIAKAARDELAPHFPSIFTGETA